MTVHYLEIVTHDVDGVAALYEAMSGLSFGAPDADLGQARVAARDNGTFVGIRRPLADHEDPIVRTYVAVDDLAQTLAAAEHAGATIALPATPLGTHGTFAIVLYGDVQHGLWQR
jgi:predicted enzyme related to lactoylglutathione lyase